MQSMISVSDRRPLAKASEELESRYGWVVGYEDPPWQDPGEMADVTEQVRRDPRPAGQGRVLVPRGGTLAWEFNVDPINGLPSDPAAMLNGMIEAHEEAGNPGGFRWEGRGTRFDIVPVGMRDVHGQPAAVAPILNTRINLEGGQRSVLDVVHEIAASLSNAGPYPVTVGQVLVNLFRQQQTSISAQGETARDVLHRLTGTLNEPISYQLFYDPGLKFYALNLHVIRKR